jgi:hypothetical protein
MGVTVPGVVTMVHLPGSSQFAFGTSTTFKSASPRIPSGGEDACQLLASVYDWFTESIVTADPRVSKALSEEMS